MSSSGSLDAVNRPRPSISVVTPVYGCEPCLRPLVDRTIGVLESFAERLEVILVDDASPDRSWETIERLSAADERVKAIQLSRNFGQHYAITAGIDHAQCDWVVVMDCDLQDNPEMIPRFYDVAREGGFDLVMAKTGGGRPEGVFARLLTPLYYAIYDLLSDYDVRSSSPSFVLMSRAVADEYRRLRENRRHFLGLLQFLGFRVGYCAVERSRRAAGKSSYSLLSRVRLALTGITASTTKLLRAGIYLGACFSVFSFAFGLYIAVNKIWIQDYSAGWSSLVTSIFFVGGILMIFLGILGSYLETIFYEVKNRPVYVVREKINIE